MSNETSSRPKPDIRRTGKWVLGVPFVEATFAYNEKKKEKRKVSDPTTRRVGKQKLRVLFRRRSYEANNLRSDIRSQEIDTEKCHL